MRKFFLLACASLLCMSAISQRVKSSLTIFSDDGKKFFLFLNGEKQNNDAQTNIRVEDLTQGYYNCKILFEDESMGEIVKKTLVVRDMDDSHQDVVYRIKPETKSGKPALRFFSAEPARADYEPAPNVVVYRYGNPVPTRGGRTVVTTTTTTTTPGTNVNMNVGGIDVNVNVNDEGYYEQTTTTTTVASHDRGGDRRPANNQRGGKDCSNRYAMSSSDFSQALSTIKNTSFDETKLSTAKQIVSSNCLKTDQVVQICNQFSFDESKLEFAKFAYLHTTDQSNYFKVSNVFSFSSSKEELNNYIMGL